MLLEGRSQNINARRRIFVSARQHVLISDNLPVRKSYFDSNILYRTKMQGYCDIFLRIILKRTSTEARVYMRRHQGAKANTLTLARDLSQIFTRRRFLYAQWGKRERHVRIKDNADRHCQSVTAQSLRFAC